MSLSIGSICPEIDFAASEARKTARAACPFPCRTVHLPGKTPLAASCYATLTPLLVAARFFESQRVCEWGHSGAPF